MTLPEIGTLENVFGLVRRADNSQTSTGSWSLLNTSFNAASDELLMTGYNQGGDFALGYIKDTDGDGIIDGQAPGIISIKCTGINLFIAGSVGNKGDFAVKNPAVICQIMNHITAEPQNDVSLI